MKVLETLLSDVPTGWRVTDVYVGANWVLSLAQRCDGKQHAGVAATPLEIAPNARFHIGHYPLDEKAEMVTQWLRSTDMTEAAVGLATLNAVKPPDERLLTSDDAADWLATKCTGRKVAVFGRFPFIDGEIRPHVHKLWVFEQKPEADELDSTSIKEVLPQADIIAITGSSVINHSVDHILAYAAPGATVILLGPSTPLSEKLFNVGIDAMFGVLVEDLECVIDGVTAGDGFRKMKGLRRVALFKRHP
jgi:uncharacterized protein (DUF4213/DUF364 family)